MPDFSIELLALFKAATETKPHDFPGRDGEVYLTRFQSSAKYLEKDVLPELEKSAILQEIKHLCETENPPSVIYLNDHGIRHVETVIERATQLLNVLRCTPSSYETYVLIMSCYLHDAGNIYGRENHESNIGRIISDMGLLIGNDTAEKKIIRRIAAAHGGNLEGDKDTISNLPVHEVVLGQKVRVQLLAAILRFADELADGYDRASRFLAEAPSLGGDGNVLDGSQIFHIYSLRLQSTTVDEGKIGLYFDLNSKDISETYRKINNDVYLIDEIFARTLKMHYENLYCMRYISSAPYSPASENINTVKHINVNIKIFKDFDDDFPEIEIVYSLREKGYPTFTHDDIYTLCPEITQTIIRQYAGVNRLDGATLRHILEEKWNK